MCIPNMTSEVAVAAGTQEMKRIDSSKMEIAALTDTTNFEQWRRTLRSVVNSALGCVPKEERKRYMAALEKGSAEMEIPDS